MAKSKLMSVGVEVSARHLHLSEQDSNILFGKGRELNQEKKLTQGDYFAASERLTLAQPAPEDAIEKRKSNEIKNVRVLGPYWKKTIVEISRTDAIKLGINPPVKDSLSINKPPKPAKIVLIGQKGKIVREAAIIPQRHLYITPNQLNNLNKRYETNLKAGDAVSVKTRGKRSLIFSQVAIRVDKNYKLKFFIDTDEANAAGLKSGDVGEIIAE